MEHNDEHDDNTDEGATLERDLKMFEDFLNGESIDAIAQKYGLSTSRVYAIAKRNRWNKFKDDKVQERMREIANKVEKKKAVEKITSQLVEHNGVLGEWVYHTILLSPGVKHFGVFPITDKNLEKVEHNIETGILIMRRFYPYKPYRE